MREEKIDPIIQSKIDEYSKLEIGEAQVCTPYFINDKRRKDLRAMVGKGTPEEIIMESRIWEKLKGAKFHEMTSSEIKQFLTDRGLGIDCSGFIVHILDAYTLEKKRRHVWNFLKIPNSGFISTLRYFLRPVEQLGASIITNSDNAFEVSLKDVKVMDLIRSKSLKLHGDHIMIITKVIYDENDIPIELEYTHSTPHYGNQNGIKTGVIRIIDINGPLEMQEWLEKDDSGICHTLEGYRTDLGDSGIRRLKFLN